jgi:hypothetical protein
MGRKIVTELPDAGQEHEIIGAGARNEDSE